MLDDIGKGFKIPLQNRISANFETPWGICHTRILQRTCPSNGMALRGARLFMRRIDNGHTIDQIPMVAWRMALTPTSKAARAWRDTATSLPAASVLSSAANAAGILSERRSFFTSVCRMSTIFPSFPKNGTNKKPHKPRPKMARQHVRCFPQLCLRTDVRTAVIVRQTPAICKLTAA